MIVIVVVFHDFDEWNFRWGIYFRTYEKM